MPCFLAVFGPWVLCNVWKQLFSKTTNGMRTKNLGSCSMWKKRWTISFLILSPEMNITVLILPLSPNPMCPVCSLCPDLKFNPPLLLPQAQTKSHYSSFFLFFFGLQKRYRDLFTKPPIRVECMFSFSLWFLPLWSSHDALKQNMVLLLNHSWWRFKIITLNRERGMSTRCSMFQQSDSKTNPLKYILI